MRYATTILEFASRHTARPRRCRLDDGVVICGNKQIALADLPCRRPPRAGHRFEVQAQAYLSPRTVAFTSTAFALPSIASPAKIRILHSVHGADIGRLINPMQCRGQIDGAIAMGFGWALRRKWSTTTAPW